MSNLDIYPDAYSLYNFCKFNQEEILNILLDIKVEGYECYIGSDRYGIEYIFFVKNENYPVLNAHIDNVWEFEYNSSLESFRSNKLNISDVENNRNNYKRYSRCYNYLYNIKNDLVLQGNLIYVKDKTSGFGADDKAGVHALLYFLLNSNLNVNYLFTNNEEIGGLGSMKFVEDFYKRINPRYFISLDRRNNMEVVFYNYENYNYEFVNVFRNYGFKKSKGIFGDVQILGLGFDVCSANLSIGYMNEHTYDEVLNFSYYLSTVIRLPKLIDMLNLKNKGNIYVMNSRKYMALENISFK